MFLGWFFFIYFSMMLQTFSRRNGSGLQTGQSNTCSMPTKSDRGRLSLCCWKEHDITMKAFLSIWPFSKCAHPLWEDSWWTPTKLKLLDRPLKTVWIIFGTGIIHLFFVFFKRRLIWPHNVSLLFLSVFDPGDLSRTSAWDLCTSYNHWACCDAKNQICQ